VDFARPVEAVIGGAQGRLLAVLLEITGPLTLRRLASLAGVSPAQASRVMPRLVELGIVDRHEVPPASQFVLARDNVAAQLLLELADAGAIALRQIKEAASVISPAPVSVIAFGSFARGEADADSDIDLAVIRGDDVDEDDERWADSIDVWRRQVRALTGNDVEIVEATVTEVRRKLRGRSELWRNIQRDGVVVHGSTLNELGERVDA
jgi:predicted nucleotidyltransferase